MANSYGINQRHGPPPRMQALPGTPEECEFLEPLLTDIARLMVERHTKPLVCACCGYKAVDVDDLLHHEPRPSSPIAPTEDK